MLSVQRSLRGRIDLHVGRNMATFQLFIQSREQVVVRRGQIRRVGWMIKKLASFFWVASARWAGALSCKNNTTLVNFRDVFLSKCPSIAPAEISNIPSWYLGPLEYNQWEDAVLIPKNRVDNFLHSEFFGRGEALCRHSIDCYFVSGS